MKRPRKPMVRFGDRYQVKGFIPSREIADIAEDRTIGLQSAFVGRGGRASDLGVFARSCYLQGVNDTVDALTQTCKPLEKK